MPSRLLIHTAFALLVQALLLSCSVREDRRGCPCYLDITLVRQGVGPFEEDTVWCSVWNGETNIYKAVFAPATGEDSLISNPVPRGRVATAVISNIEQEAGRISVPAGSQMDRLYVSRQDVECTGDVARMDFSSSCKQYVNVTFILNEDARPYMDVLSLSLDGPYDGLALPSMKPHNGTFRYSCCFDSDGKARVRISPQGGPGLKVGIRMGNNPPALVDLYRTMLNAGFDWTDSDLGDFEATLGLNAVSHIGQIVDWDIVQMDAAKY